MANSIPMIPGPQVVPSAVCFQCKVCCRFPEHDSLLRPYFTAREIEQAVTHGVPPSSFPDHRGSQVSIRHEQGYPIMQALIARGVIGDFRAPDILRFGFTPLYVRYTDIWDAVAVLREIMETGAWDTAEFKRRAAVT